MANKLEVMAMRFCTASKSQWADLVEMACEIGPERFEKASKVLASQTGTSQQTLHRKFKAIHLKRSEGLTCEAIKELGQAETISGYVKAKRAKRTDALVPFPHKLTQPVRDDLEVLCQRLGKILKVKTYDQVFEVILSLFIDLSDAEIWHLIGEGNAEEKKSQARG
jgi:hypothetical protein